MNENQSAHGDREYGHIVSRMGIERKVIVGHWASESVQRQLGSWMRTAIGVIESSHVRVCRFGDNMNNVAVTEGDKVEAQIKFGWEIDHYCVNDVVEYVDAVPQGEVNALVEEYYSKYKIIDEGRDAEDSADMWRYRHSRRSVLKNSLRRMIITLLLPTSACWAA